MEAYRFYAEGRDIHLRGSLREAIPHYENAVAADPDFAMALRALSTGIWTVWTKGERHSKAVVYAQRAFEQAEQLPPRERGIVEGWYHILEEATWDRAIEEMVAAARSAAAPFGWPPREVTTAACGETHPVGFGFAGILHSSCFPRARL